MVLETADERRTAPDCPVCGRHADVLSHGMVAPFVSEVCGLPASSPCRYCECSRCDFRFFDVRYRQEEMAALYGGYRSDRYFAIRRRWEPWYSRSVNDAYSSPGRPLEDRREFMMKVLVDASMPQKLGIAVDVGGDEGQFFPAVPTAQRIVCEVSDRELPEGVRRIESLDELGSDKADLLMIAHVLEHLPDPEGPLHEAKGALGPEGMLYVEVPLDRFKVPPVNAQQLYQRYLQRLSRHRLAFIGVDFLSGLTRQAFSMVPPFGVVKQSEHINYFSPASLRHLVEASGFRVISERADPRATVGGLRLGRFGLAARLATPGDQS